MSTAPVRTVEVITPASAPHLQRIGQDLQELLEVVLAKSLAEAGACGRLVQRVSEAIAAGRAYQRFRERLDSKLTLPPEDIE